LLIMMLMSIEWHILAGFITVLGFAFPPLLWVALLMFITPAALGIVSGVQAPNPRHKHWLARPLIAYLHYRQPITRGWARYSVRLKNKVMKQRDASGFRRPELLPFDPLDRNTLRYWSIHHGRFALLDKITEEVRAAGWRMRQDSGWNGWDLEIYGSRYVKISLTTATEHHHHVGKLTRVRVQPIMSNFCRALLGASVILALLLVVRTWPFSRPALLIPMSWWAMYLVNRFRVVNSVLGLIDESAEKAGFYPVPAKKIEERRPARPAAQNSALPPVETEVKPQPVADAEQREDLDFEEGTPSVA
jgi:hypothetical protein